MGDVIQVRGRFVSANRRGRISIAIWVIDGDKPEDARWRAQRQISAAAGFRALKGFTDERNGKRHPFSCAPSRLNQFGWGIEPLINAGRVRVEVAGKRVRSRLSRKAG